MTSALKTTKKKSTKTKTPAKSVVAKAPAKSALKPASTRKEARRSTLLDTTASSRAKIVSKAVQTRPKPQLVRTRAVRTGLSSLAKEAVDRDKARRLQAAAA